MTTNESKKKKETEAEEQVREEAEETPETPETPEKPETEEAEETQSCDSEDQAETKSAEEEEDQNTKYLRLMADFQNYKRRVEKEKSGIYAHANEKIVTDLLEVLDNFERALDHEAEDESYKAGMDMIFKQLFEVLERFGLKEIAALGEEFDPNFHNAVMNEESEEYESGIVSGVMQKGYTLNGKVIRPAMVKVAN